MCSLAKTLIAQVYKYDVDAVSDQNVAISNHTGQLENVRLKKYFCIRDKYHYSMDRPIFGSAYDKANTMNCLGFNLVRS